MTALVLAGAVTSPALAQDPEVIVDPDSPSGKEYAIPLERARDEAAGGKGDSPAPSSNAAAPKPAPLFGVGITIKKPSTAGKSRKRVARATPQTSPKPARPTEEAAPAVPPRNLLRQAAAPDGGISDIALLGAGGAAVLLLGGLLGVALRRRSGAGGNP